MKHYKVFIYILALFLLIPSTLLAEICQVKIPPGQDLSRFFSNKYHDNSMDNRAWRNWMYGSKGILSNIIKLNPNININKIAAETIITYDCQLAKNLPKTKASTEENTNLAEATESEATKKTIPSLKKALPLAALLTDKEDILSQDQDIQTTKAHSASKSKDLRSPAQSTFIKPPQASLSPVKKKVKLQKSKDKKTLAIIPSQQDKERKKNWNLLMDVQVAWEKLSVTDSLRQSKGSLYTPNSQHLGVMLERSLNKKSHFFFGHGLKHINFNDPDNEFALTKKVKFLNRFHLGFNYSTQTTGHWTFRYSFGEELYLYALNPINFQFEKGKSHAFMLQNSFHLRSYRDKHLFLSPSLNLILPSKTDNIDPETAVALHLIPSLSFTYNDLNLVASFYNQLKWLKSDISKQVNYSLGLSLSAYFPNFL